MDYARGYRGGWFAAGWAAPFSLVALVVALLFSAACESSGGESVSGSAGETGSEARSPAASGDTGGETNGGAVEDTIAGVPPGEATNPDGAARSIQPGEGPGRGYLLCQSEEELVYASAAGGDEERGGLAVAADRLGNFTLYAYPDPQTGRPTVESNYFLSDCDLETGFPRGPSFPTLEVDGEAYRAQEEDVLLAETEETGDGALLTTYRFGGEGAGGREGGVVLERSLRVVGGDETATGLPELRISYEVENESGRPHRMGLRSLIAPIAAGRANSASEPVGPSGVVEPVPVFFAPGIDEGIPYEQYLPEENLGQRFVAGERRGVPKDSSFAWSPAPGSESPTLVTFAEWRRLYDAAYDYQPRYYWPLPKQSAFASYWEEREIGPGETVAFAELYGPATAEQLRAAGAPEPSEAPVETAP